MSRKQNTVVKQSLHVQEESDPELSAQEQITALHKSRQNTSTDTPKILAFTNANEFDNEEKLLKLLKLKFSSMSLSEILEFSTASLLNDPSPENELRQSAILMESISGRVEHIVTHTYPTSLIPPYVQEYIGKVSNYAERIISFFKVKADPKITDITVDHEDNHDALQREVIRMIEIKTTPNGERYNTREKQGSKKENAEEFLLRVYEKFKKTVENPTDENYTYSPFPLQGIYQDQLKKIDPELLAALNQLTKIKTASMVLPKEARNDRKISELKINLNIDKKTIGMISSRIRKFAT